MSVQSFQENIDPAVLELEQRQEAILAQLQKLETEVNELAKNWENKPTAATSTTTGTTVNGVNGFQDVVISANPSSPPYSLFVLYSLLQQQYKTLASSYAHSSVASMPERLKGFFTEMSNGPRINNQLMITVIWKDVSNGPVMMVDPKNQTPIEGEASIARYLSRLLNPSYDSSDPVTATVIDTWLDTAQQLLNGNNKEKAAVVRSLNSQLGKNTWLVGTSLSLADIVMWSALHQSQQASSAQGNVKKWLQACNNHPAFQRVLMLVS